MSDRQVKIHEIWLPTRVGAVEGRNKGSVANSKNGCNETYIHLVADEKITVK